MTINLIRGRRQNAEKWEPKLFTGGEGPSLGSGLKLGDNTGFKIFTIESHSTLPILDGALKITCADTPLSVNARICTNEDFAAVHASIMENNGVRL